MKAFELTKDACEILCKCIKHRMGYLETVNEVYIDARKEGEIWSDEIVNAYNENCESLGKLQTLLNYIES